MCRIDPIARTRPVAEAVPTRCSGTAVYVLRVEYRLCEYLDDAIAIAESINRAAIWLTDHQVHARWGVPYGRAR